MQAVQANGASIPLIGLGTWDLRGRSCARLVEQALRLGYRHVDTAQMYENEREVGEGVRGSGVRRKEIFVTTKIWPSHFAPNDLERSVKESLVKLRLSEVDLLLLHWPNPQIPLSETMGALCKMKSAGFARHIGVSNFTVALIEAAVQFATEPLATNQIECHPFLDQSKVIAACRRHGIAITAYCPLARGQAMRDETLTRIGRRHGKSGSQVALRYLVQQRIAAIPRTSRVERLSENLEVFDFELDEAEMEEIRGLAKPGGRILDAAWAPKWD